MVDEQIGECPIMILGNKIDKPGAASEDEIRHYFSLHGRTTGRVRNTHLTSKSKGAQVSVNWVLSLSQLLNIWNSITYARPTL